MSLTPKQVEWKYDLISPFYNVGHSIMEHIFFRKWRRNLLRTVGGNVLEIGIGTGKNIPFYDFTKVTLTATDISGRMLRKAEKNAGRKNIRFVHVQSERLPFPNNSFDVIVGTFVLCSVSSQQKMVQEMKRVLKPKGKILLLEHVRSAVIPIRIIQNILNPLTVFCSGVHVNRDTVKAIKQAGMAIQKETNLLLVDVFKKWEVVQ